MCYLDIDGNGRPSITHAKKYDDIEMARAAALTCGGHVVEVIDRPKQKEKNKSRKSNQAWMRGGK